MVENHNNIVIPEMEESLTNDSLSGIQGTHKEKRLTWESRSFEFF